jgi:hypothetical protein
MRMKRMMLVVAGLLASSGAASPGTALAPAAPAAQAPKSQADQSLKALYVSYASWLAMESGYFEVASGETKAADYLP